MPFRFRAWAPALLSLYALTAGAQEKAGFVLQSKHFEVHARDKAVAEKKAKALELSAGIFTKMFGAAPCRGCVKLLRAGQGNASAVSFDGGGAAGTGSGALATVWSLEWFNPPFDEPKDPDDLMTHEAAHHMFTKWFEAAYKPKGPPRADRVASKAPDWLDEAIAVWHEPEVMKAERRRHVRQQIDAKRLPFEAYFASEHPLADELNGKGDYAAAFKAKHDQLDVYYSQSFGIIEFLNAAGGQKIVLKFINEHTDGSTTAEVLVKMKMPAIRTPQMLEAAYVEWVKKNYKSK